jgi:hypothetical protein
MDVRHRRSVVPRGHPRPVLDAAEREPSVRHRAHEARGRCAKACVTCARCPSCSFLS